MCVNLIPLQFKETVCHAVPGMHGNLCAQTEGESEQLALYVAATMGCKGYLVKETNVLMLLNQALPDTNLSKDLSTLKLKLTPTVVYLPDGSPFALVASDGRMYFAQNIPQEERRRILKTDLGLLDQSSKNRAAFYGHRYGFKNMGGLPALDDGQTRVLEGKCPKNIPIPQLLNGGEVMAVFNHETTVTTVTLDGSIIYNSNLYHPDVGLVLPPMSEAFTDHLNSGRIKNFTIGVEWEGTGNNQLKIQVAFDLDGEHIVDKCVRRAIEYSAGSMAVTFFGKYGALVYSNSDELAIRPAKACFNHKLRNLPHQIYQVQGGIRFLQLYQGKSHLGMVELPPMMQRNAVNEVAILADIGQTSYAVGLKLDNTIAPPIPVTFEADKDILPLISISESVRNSICNDAWFPVAMHQTGRSVAHMLHNEEESLVPYGNIRCFFNQSGHELDISESNGLYGSFKYNIIITNHTDMRREEAYTGFIASVLMLGLHKALQYSDTVSLKLSYPNNPQFQHRYEECVNAALGRISMVLRDKADKPISFKSVDYKTESYLSCVGVNLLGVNGKLGTTFKHYALIDQGGSTTDCTMKNNGNILQLPAIPIAGQIVTQQSLLQAARLFRNGKSALRGMLQNTNDTTCKIIDEHLAPLIKNQQGSGSREDNLEAMVNDPVLLENVQKLLDYGTLTVDPQRGALLRSLICMKELLLQDMVLRQYARAFDSEEKGQMIHVLRLGNGSKSMQLICPQGTIDYARRMEKVLQTRADYHAGMGLTQITNQNPKSEVVNGLAVYDEKGTDDIPTFVDDTSCQTLEELEMCLPAARAEMMETVKWLAETVPNIVDTIQPLDSGIYGGFTALLENMQDEDACEAVLQDTLNKENGRFGDVFKNSSGLATSVWVSFAIMDETNRVLARAQATAGSGWGTTK